MTATSAMCCTSVSFGILSSDEIQQTAVCEIHESKKRANTNHIYDKRMGTTFVRTTEQCETCGMGIKDCPGHFGMINLTIPILHPMFVKHIVDALRLVCYKCHCILSMGGDSALPISVFCNACKSIQPIYSISKDECGVERIYASNDDTAPNVILMAPYDILEIFKDADFNIIRGMKHNPKDLILTSLVVLPTISRPSIFVNGNQCDDDLSYVYIEIIKLNNKIRELASNVLTTPPAAATLEHNQIVSLIRTISNPLNSNQAKRLKSKVGVITPEILSKLVGQIEMYVKTFMNNSSQVKYQNDKVIKCIKSRLNGKSGLMRGNIQGKRVNFVGRTCIGPDAYIDVDEIVLPDHFVKTLTLPITVSKYNIDELNRIIKSGRATYIFRGEDQYLPSKYFKLRCGDVVERHLMSGDFVCLNRAPTLHTGSMIGLRVRVLNTQQSAADLNMKPAEYRRECERHDRSAKTIRFNIPACNTLNADFDGDECNIHVPQTLPAMVELQEMMSVRKHLMMSKGQLPILALSQDTIIGLYLLTFENIKLDAPRWMNLVFMCGGLDNRPDFDDLQTASTSYSAFSSILPYGFNYSSDAGGVCIKNGCLVAGQLTKATISNRPLSIPHIILQSYDENEYIDFMNRAVRLANAWLTQRTFTIGLGDFIIKSFEDVESKALDNIIKLVPSISRRIGDFIVMDTSQIADNKMYFVLNNSKELGNTIIKNNLSNNNNLKLIVDSGSKGTYVNIMQITAMMGQQIIDGKRAWPCYKQERSLPCYLSPKSACIWGSSDAGSATRCMPTATYNETYNDAKSDNKNDATSAESNIQSDIPSTPILYDNTTARISKTQLRFPWSWNKMTQITVSATQHTTQHKSATTNATARPPKLSISKRGVPEQPAVCGGGGLRGRWATAPLTFKSFIRNYFESGGFIMSSLMDGLNPCEFFFHAMGGRDGILETSCKTSVTGYLERRLTKMCEDVQVGYNRNVVNTINGRCIQMNESRDFFNPSMLVGYGKNAKIILRQDIFE